MGIFGNPNVDYTGDWISTIAEEADKQIKTAGEQNTARNSCKFVSALEVEVLTSLVGYTSKA